MVQTKSVFDGTAVQAPLRNSACLWLWRITFNHTFNQLQVIKISSIWPVSSMEGSLLGVLNPLEGGTGQPAAQISTPLIMVQGGYLAILKLLCGSPFCNVSYLWPFIKAWVSFHALNSHFFGIWGILKARLFSPRPQTLLQLRTRLDQEVLRLGADQAMLR